MKWNTVIASACLFAVCGCAVQQDIAILDQRLTALERKSREMEQQNAEAQKKTAQLSSLMQDYPKSREEQDQEMRGRYAEMRAELTGFREEVRNLRGRVEEASHLVSSKVGSIEDVGKQRENLVGHLEEVTASNKDRIKRIEQYLNLETAPEKPAAKPAPVAAVAPPQPQPQQPPQAVKEPSEEALYASAKQAFDQGNNEQARQGFENLVKKYPKSSLAGSAQFWIGEIFFRQKWYEKAIVEYQKVIENYSDGNKVPASLLKQALAFHNLGGNANARLILQELIKKYPSSNEAAVARQKMQELEKSPG